MDTFDGFSPATFQFFRDLKNNNNKEWFDTHKSTYESEILKPLKVLVSALSPVMHNIDSEFELRPTKVLSRIYRDTRFSKNKEPYKSCMWFTFQIPIPREEWTDVPGYFMEIAGDSYTLGMGLFQPKKKVMDNFRDEISYNASEFEKETKKNVLKRGFDICGEEYKRPISNDLSEYFQPWIQRKGIWVAKTMPIGDEVYSSEFVKIIADDFISLSWLYNFMKEVSTL